MAHRLAPRRYAALAVVAPLVLLFSACKTDDLPDASTAAYTQSVSAFYTGLAAVQAGEDLGGRERFVQVTELAPGEPAAWANLGVLALRRNDFDEAERMLLEARDRAPDHGHVEWLLGSLAAAQGQYGEAATHYRRAVEVDSSNLKAAYSLALELERQGTDANEQEALERVRQLAQRHPNNTALALEYARLAVKRDAHDDAQSAVEALASPAGDWPSDVQAQYADFSAAVGARNARAASTSLAFLRNLLLQDAAFRTDLAALQTPVEQPGDFITRLLRLPDPPRSPAPPDTTMRFSAGEVLVPLPNASHTGVVYPSSESSPVTYAVQGASLVFSNAARLPFPGEADRIPPGADPVAAFDFDYDFNTDLAVAGPDGFRLYRGDGQGAFEDVTQLSGIPAALVRGAYQGVWVFDLDTEADLDLILAATDGPPVILRNNGDGTFSVGRAFNEVSSVKSFAWADLDEDADPDAALVDGSGRLHVYLNERGGLFRKTETINAPPLAFVTAGDVDADGRFELLGVSTDGTVQALRLGQDSEPLVQLDDARRVIVADLDNNGALDLIVSSDRESLAALTPAANAPAPQIIRMDVPVSDVADFNGDGRLDLVALRPEGSTILMNEGSFSYQSQVLWPRATQATGDQRINSFGVGGQVETRSGLLFQKQLITRPHMHFGLGEHQQTDVARIIWPNGDIQAEFSIAAGQPLLAQQRLKGSCPWVFVYDGEGIAFITDFIWRSPLGLAINGQEQAGVVLTADRVRIPGDRLVARDGFYDVRITAELWETHFFDEVSLLAVDHPEGTEVYVDERFSIPAPDLAPHLMSALKPVVRAHDHHGTDVTHLVTDLDARYLGTFARGRYQGVAEDHYVEIEVGAEAPRGKPVWLVASGWVRPTDSSVNVAMSQGDNPPPRDLRLEAQDEHGQWQLVADNLGFPAGKTKTLLFPIGDVLSEYPAGKLRLHTNLEIYWDALHWAEGLDSDAMQTTTLSADRAELRYRGYSDVTSADASSPEIPHYDRFRTANRQWFDLEGYYTRFGDVRPLLATVDNRYVIMNAGDELAFAFAELPPPAPGQRRTYFLQGDGWVKDGDFNTTHSRTVRPLPLHEDTDYQGPLLPLREDPGYLVHPTDWQEYHTRYVAPDGFATALAPLD